jgi:indolepyruvate ferredoxin oxidoreductase beta subunit
MGVAEYPEGILEVLNEKADTLVFKAGEIAESLGTGKAMNIVLLGALVKAMKVEGVDWHKAIRNNVKEKFIDVNIKAFEAGYAL